MRPFQYFALNKNQLAINSVFIIAGETELSAKKDILDERGKEIPLLLRNRAENRLHLLGGGIKSEVILTCSGSQPFD